MLQDSNSVVFQIQLTLSSSCKEKQIKVLFIIINIEDHLQQYSKFSLSITTQKGTGILSSCFLYSGLTL